MADHDRPLSPRGVRAAPLMGQSLAAFENPPTLILTSTAKRAMDTAEITAESFRKYSSSKDYQADLEVITNSGIYGASSTTLIEILKEIPQKNVAVVVVGHNPVLEEFISLLCFNAIDGGLFLPTGALAHVSAEINHWNQLQRGVGTLHALIFPRLVSRLLYAKKK
jgi:phosphohistidine phosphatase